MNPRWEALVKYDDEIHAAAQQLQRYGDHWVAKLGEAFFALHEDRKYLPNMVASLITEASEALASEWLMRFRRTAEGEFTTERSLNILFELEKVGYNVTVENNGTFAVHQSPTSTTFLRSNDSIERIGEGLLALHRKQPST